MTLINQTYQTLISECLVFNFIASAYLEWRYFNLNLYRDLNNISPERIAFKSLSGLILIKKDL